MKTQEPAVAPELGNNMFLASFMSPHLDSGSSWRSRTAACQVGNTSRISCCSHYQGTCRIPLNNIKLTTGLPHFAATGFATVRSSPRHAARKEKRPLLHYGAECTARQPSTLMGICFFGTACTRSCSLSVPPGRPGFQSYRTLSPSWPYDWHVVRPWTGNGSTSRPGMLSRCSNPEAVFSRP